MASHENLRLAYQSQLENIREAKRLVWQATYFGVLSLSGLAAGFHIAREFGENVRGARYVLTGLGVVVAAATCVIVRRGRSNMNVARDAVQEIAKKLEPGDGTFVGLIGADYDRTRDDTRRFEGLNPGS